MIDLTSEEKMFIKMAAHNDVIRSVVMKHMHEINGLAQIRHDDDIEKLMKKLLAVQRAMIDFCGLFE